MKNIDEILAERENTHGNFQAFSEINQSLKGVLHNCNSWGNLSASQKEALKMIMYKISRIMNGDANYVDHWTDVAGYATLIKNELMQAQEAGEKRK